MKSLHQSPIKVKPSTVQGYGVFAEADIAADSIIEECYFLTTHDQITLFNYLFKYIVNDKLKYCLPLGYGAIYNHSNEPNATFGYNEEMSLLVFTSLRPIKAGEEIFVSYGQRWFDIRQAKPLQTSLSWRTKRMIAKLSFIMRAAICSAAIYLAIYLLHSIKAG